MCLSNDAVPNEHSIKIFLQPSALRPDCPDQPSVNNAAFVIRGLSSSSNAIWWTGPVDPSYYIAEAGLLFFWCFCFNIFKVFSVKGRFCLRCNPSKVLALHSCLLYQVLMFPLSSFDVFFIKFWCFLYQILNFNEFFFSAHTYFLLSFILSWIVAPSCKKLLIIPSSHNFSCLLSGVKWCFDLVLVGFWNNVYYFNCLQQQVLNPKFQVYCFKCNCLRQGVLNPKFWKTSYFVDILFPCGTTWQY